MLIKRMLVCLAALLLMACNEYTEGKFPVVQAFLGDSAIPTNQYELSPLDPSLPLKETVKIQIQNIGKADLIIEEVVLMDTNPDGSPKNKWVTLKQLSASAFPFTIPFDDPYVSLTYEVIYAPDDLDNNAATLLIRSNDKDHPEKHIRFFLSECAPRVRVDPSKDTFFNATVTKPEEKIFQIHNDGNCELVFDRVQEDHATSVFTLIDQPITGTAVAPKGAPGYAPLTFTVRYQPNSTSADDKIKYFVYTSDEGNSPLPVTLSTKAEGGTYAVSYGTQASGVLDYTDVSAGEKTITVNIYNDGPAVFTLTKLTMVGDEEATHYTTAMEWPATGPGKFPEPIGGPPVALAQGKTVDIHVTYKASTLVGLNAKFLVNYNQPGASTFAIPAYGGDPKPCFDVAPGEAVSPVGVQFVGAQGEDITEHVVVYNCGNAPLSITNIRIEDDFYPDQPSSLWTLTDPGTTSFNLPVGGLQVLSLALNVSDNSLKAGGTLYIDYIDSGGSGVTFTGIDLQGMLDAEETTLPIADPGDAADYAGATAGQVLQLDGTGTTAGSEGLYEKGYLWYLLARPAGSLMILNGAPGLPIRTIIPDVPGLYRIGLRVHGNSGNFLYSDEATVDITVP